MSIVRCRRCGSPTSGFAPRCAQCGAWRRVFGASEGESTEWRRVVTAALAVAAVTIALLDLRQLRRSEWLADAGPTGASPSRVHTMRSGAPESAPASSARLSAPSVRTEQIAASSNSRGASPAPHTGTTNTGGYGVAGGADASTSSGEAADAPGDARAGPQGSITSALADWFQRVAFGRGRAPDIGRDSTDSLTAAGALRTRIGNAAASSSSTSRSRPRSAAQRNARGAARAGDAQ